MHSLVLLQVLALAAAPLVAAHGKITVATGDQGGNTTALGIIGGIVPGAGKNSVTEVDTTVFKSTNIATDGLGRTEGGGKNKVTDFDSVFAQSGSTLPQVSQGGSISGTFHIVTTDGAGPLSAIIDPTATGAFSDGTPANILTQIPGKKGNIAAPRQRDRLRRALENIGLVKRGAKNVNQEFPFSIAIPAGTTCSGTVEGQSNVCLLKVSNPSNAGPFGGVLAFQMAKSAGASSNSTRATPAVKRAPIKFSA